MSGLNLASQTADQMFSLHLLVDWLAGLSGTSEYQENISNIVRVIVAGNYLFIHFPQLMALVHTP